MMNNQDLASKIREEIANLQRVLRFVEPCVFCDDTRRYSSPGFFDSYTGEHEYTSVSPCPHCLDKYGE